MNISANNFFSNLHGVRYNNWGYESAGKLYDIWEDKITGQITYTTNSKLSEKTKYHSAVISHYNLKNVPA